MTQLEGRLPARMKPLTLKFQVKRINFADYIDYDNLSIFPWKDYRGTAIEGAASYTLMLYTFV